MLNTQPRRVFIASAALAFVAGQVNAIGVVGVFHEAMSHVTGTVTRGAVAIAALDVAGAARAAGIVAAFAVGALASGGIVGSRELRDGSRYAVGIAVEGVLLLIAWLLLRNGIAAGEHFGAMASGLQNGLVTTWSGAVVRTSHVTGVLTDIGVAVGLRLRGVPFDRRLALHLLLLAGFAAGGITGALLWRPFAFDALCVPIFICAVLAVLARRRATEG